MTLYRGHRIRTIGGSYQVLGIKLSNGGRTWISDHGSLVDAKTAIDQYLRERGERLLELASLGGTQHDL